MTVPDSSMLGAFYRVGNDVEEQAGANSLFLQLLIATICMALSFVFSALNLGLMGLGITELEMLAASGTPQQRIRAKRVLPIRKRGNFLLCSIILVNTLVNSIFTVILDKLLTSVGGIIVSTIAIVILGEILPQSLGVRHALALGAKTIYLTYVGLIITFPVAYPMGRLLDLILGEEVGSMRTRENLKALVIAAQEQIALETSEVKIITGTLEMSQKKVEDVMTRLSDCYMLDVNTVLDFDVIAEIVTNGFSRVPVYKGGRSNVVSILFTKDLAVVDPDDAIPLKNIIRFQPQAIYSVPKGTLLTKLFRDFKTGINGHMAFVTSSDKEVVASSDKELVVSSDKEVVASLDKEMGASSDKEVVGLVTLEDIIEEIIQEEIVDETDLYASNRSVRKRNQRRLLKDFMKYTESFDKKQVNVSRRLILVSYQYLSQSQTPFLPQYVSPTVLMRMLYGDIYHRVKAHETELIYEEGTRADFFVMILEGRVVVHVGAEKMRFESGVFTCFGTRALLAVLDKGEDSAQTGATTDNRVANSSHRDTSPATQNANPDKLDIDQPVRSTGFYPDYSVKARGELIYLKVDQSLYQAALQATAVERSNGQVHVPANSKYASLYEKNASSDHLLV